ncbi:MAG: CBS domain-containing protein [Rhodothermaceae bacterium]|nr:CBS domain-containing protein [Rhodothermaceae bacterium]
MSQPLQHFIINEDATLKDALIQMTSSHRGILLVTDKDLNLVGVLTDGDVRRALLADVSLGIPITQIMNLNPVIASNREEAEIKLNKNPYFILIPVVDSKGRLLGVLSALNGKNYYENTAGHKETQDDVRIGENKMHCAAIIPARGGSKRIPGKNLSRIGDETLLSLAIKSALNSRYIEHIIVSTDSREIADEAERNGVNVPWLRPEELSGDKAKTVDVMIHATEMFRKTYSHVPDMIVLLEPTAPLRTQKLIDQAIEMFETTDADSLVSVNKIRHIYHPEELLVADDKGFLRPYLKDRTFDSRKLRDEQQSLYMQNGLVYITRTDVLQQQKSIYGEKVIMFETDSELFADIDEPEDLEIARIKFKKLSQQN